MKKDIYKLYIPLILLACIFAYVFYVNKEGFESNTPWYETKGGLTGILIGAGVVIILFYIFILH
jgi:hypothetical protein